MKRKSWTNTIYSDNNMSCAYAEQRTTNLNPVIRAKNNVTEYTIRWISPSMASDKPIQNKAASSSIIRRVQKDKTHNDMIWMRVDYTMWAAVFIFKQMYILSTSAYCSILYSQQYAWHMAYINDIYYIVRTVRFMCSNVSYGWLYIVMCVVGPDIRMSRQSP